MKLKASACFVYQIEYPTPIIAVLSPRKDINQQVLTDVMTVTPSIEIFHYTDNFGNACQRMLFEKGEVELKIENVVIVDSEVKRDLNAAYVLIEDLPFEAIQFLLPSRYCHSDTPEIINLAFEITKNIEIGNDQVLAICKWIYENISYQYGFSFYTSNSNDILKNKVGVCRDFAHLAMSLCRSINIPARMVVGFLKDLPYSDLHAWFEVFIGGKWFTFDAVQEKTLGGRIVLAYGRDANDVAFITQFGNPLLKEMRVIVEEVQ